MEGTFGVSEPEASKRSSGLICAVKVSVTMHCGRAQLHAQMSENLSNCRNSVICVCYIATGFAFDLCLLVRLIEWYGFLDCICAFWPEPAQ